MPASLASKSLTRSSGVQALPLTPARLRLSPLPVCQLCSWSLSLASCTTPRFLGGRPVLVVVQVCFLFEQSIDELE